MCSPQAVIICFSSTSSAQRRQSCLPDWCEASSLEEKGRNLAQSDSNSSFLRLYLDVVQLHFQKAALPYAVGLPWDTLCRAQRRAKLAFSLFSQKRMWLDLCHSPHMVKHSHLAPWRHLHLLRIANKPPEGSGCRQRNRHVLAEGNAECHFISSGCRLDHSTQYQNTPETLLDSYAANQKIIRNMAGGLFSNRGFLKSSFFAQLPL